MTRSTAKMKIQPGETGTVFVNKEAHPTGPPFRAQARFRLLDGTLVGPMTRTGKTKKAAKNALELAMRQRINGKAGDAVPKDRRTMAEWANEWLDQGDIDGVLAVNSRRLYRNNVNKHLAGSELAQLTPVQVTAADVKDWLHGVSGPGAAKTCRAVVNGIMGRALDAGVITVNVVDDIGKVKYKKAVATRPVRDHRKALEDDEIDRLLRFAYSNPRSWPVGFEPKVKTRKGRSTKDIADIISFMLDTGVRIGEALALRWCDLDLDTELPTARINGSLSRVTGIGIVRDRTKTDGSERAVRLIPPVVEMLRRRMEHVDKAPDLPIFPAPGRWATSGGGWRDPSNIQKDIRAVLDAPEVDLSWVTPHTFRRTLLTDLGDLAPTRMVQKQAGHTDGAMTQRVYIDPAKSDGLDLMGQALTTATKDRYRYDVEQSA